MEGKTIGLLLTTALLTMSVMSWPVLAADTTKVTIRGTVKANTCTVNPQVDGALDPVSVRDFVGKVGQPLGLVEIPVSFTGCGGGTTGVKVKVSGTPVGNDGAFKNEDEGVEGGAKNIGVYFYDTNGTPIRAGTSDATEQKFSKDTKLTYKASYVSLSDDIGAGSLRTVITLNFTYL